MLRTWRALAPFVPRVRAQVALMVLLGLVGGIAEAVALLISLRVALSLSNGSETITLPLLPDVGVRFLVVIAVVAGIVALLSHLAISRVNGVATGGLLERLRARTTAAYLGATWETQAAEREGVLQETTSTLAMRSAQLIQAYVAFGANAVMLLVFIGVSLIVSPSATFIVVAVGIGIFGALRPIARATQLSGAASTMAGSMYSQEVARFSSTSMEFKVFGVQAAAQDGLARASRLASRAQQRSRFYSFVGISLFRDVAILLLAACVGVLAFVGVSTDAVEIFTVITLVVRALSSAQSINGGLQLIHEHSSDLTTVIDRIERWTAAEERHGDRVLDSFESIRLNDVGYRYPGSDRGVHDIDLVIDAGDAIAMIGHSGAGKSTVVQLLLRLRRPTSGGIRLDGVALEEIDDAAWARLIGFVPQEPSLLEGTTASNIDFNRGLSRDVIERAAAEAHVIDDVRALDGGFDHVLGPRGAGLSGGQKQRVAIARALAGQPKLLVLDEPSSALDPRSEQLLAETLTELKGRTTLVIVAHRRRTIAMCDRIIVMDGGTMVEVGTRDELRQREGFYRSMLID